MSKKDKILHSTDKYQLVERDGLIGVKSMSMDVIVMPFTCDESKLPLLIGVVNETNPFRDGGMNISLLSGNSEGEDPDVFSSAKRALEEASGIIADDSDKWYYLGASTASRFVDEECPCFAVDITGMEDQINKESGFKFIPANDVVKAKDIFIPGLFLKLFKYVMGMDISNPDQKGEPKNNNIHKLNL